MATINISRCIKRNEPTLINFTTATNSYQGEGENFSLDFEAADERCYIIVRNDGNKSVYCGFYNPETFNIDGKKLVEGRTTVVIPIESGKLARYNSNILLNLSPVNSSDSLSDSNVSVAAFQSGIITK